jgi:hypothetical protein
MGARYSRRFGSSATSVATRDSQNSFRRGASQKQRPEGQSPRSPTRRNLKGPDQIGVKISFKDVGVTALS